MKTFFALSLIALSSSAFANPIDVVIYGNGGKSVCIYRDTDTKKYFIARAQTQMEAETVANNACDATSSFGQCRKSSCVEDPANASLIQARVTVNIGGENVTLVVGGMRLGGQCRAKYSDGFDSKKYYFAKAGTQEEAKAIAFNACLQNSSWGEDDCKHDKCAAINEKPTVTVNDGGTEIKVPDLIDELIDLFKPKPKKENKPIIYYKPSPNNN